MDPGSKYGSQQKSTFHQNFVEISCENTREFVRPARERVGPGPDRVGLKCYLDWGGTRVGNRQYNRQCNRQYNRQFNRQFN